MNKRVLYVVPASLLFRAAELLQPPEKLCFVTGMKFFGGRLIVLTQCFEVATNSSSRIHVRPKGAAVYHLQQRLQAMGLDIEAQFHSHPGRTIQATHPSSTDIHTASRWESGAPFLGAIFSEGGRHVRFFNHNQHSEIFIYGKHKATTEPNCFELPVLSEDPMPTEAGEPQGLEDDRSPREILLVGPIENS